MSGRKKDRGLGRGLSALMSDAGLNEPTVPVDSSENDALETKSEPKPPLGQTEEEARLVQQLVDTRKEDAPRQEPRILHVAISRLQRNPDQPRKLFDRDKLDDLIASIQQKGVLQPILVRQIDEDDRGHFQIVAGERRWQAALKAGLISVPVMVRDLSDRDVLEIGVIENVQRADLNPLEEALAYERLITEFGRTQAEIATSIGRSRVHVANTVRLTGLTERGRELLMQGQITAGHARALLAADDPDSLAETIVQKGLSVRDSERWVREDKSPKTDSRKTKNKPADIIALEQRIRDETGFSATINQTGKGGEIRLSYNDLDHLETLLERLGLMGR